MDKGVIVDNSQKETSKSRNSVGYEPPASKRKRLNIRSSSNIQDKKKKVDSTSESRPQLDKNSNSSSNGKNGNTSPLQLVNNYLRSSIATCEEKIEKLTSENKTLRVIIDKMLLEFDKCKKDGNKNYLKEFLYILSKVDTKALILLNQIMAGDKNMKTRQKSINSIAHPTRVIDNSNRVSCEDPTDTLNRVTVQNDRCGPISPQIKVREPASLNEMLAEGNLIINDKCISVGNENAVEHFPTMKDASQLREAEFCKRKRTISQTQSAKIGVEIVSNGEKSDRFSEQSYTISNNNDSVHASVTKNKPDLDISKVETLSSENKTLKMIVNKMLQELDKCKKGGEKNNLKEFLYILSKVDTDASILVNQIIAGDKNVNTQFTEQNYSISKDDDPLRLLVTKNKPDLDVETINKLTSENEKLRVIINKILLELDKCKKDGNKNYLKEFLYILSKVDPKALILLNQIIAGDKNMKTRQKPKNSIAHLGPKRVINNSQKITVSQTQGARLGIVVASNGEKSDRRQFTEQNYSSSKDNDCLQALVTKNGPELDIEFETDVTEHHLRESVDKPLSQQKSTIRETFLEVSSIKNLELFDSIPDDTIESDSEGELVIKEESSDSDCVLSSNSSGMMPVIIQASNRAANVTRNLHTTAPAMLSNFTSRIDPSYYENHSVSNVNAPYPTSHLADAVCALESQPVDELGPEDFKIVILNVTAAKDFHVRNILPDSSPMEIFDGKTTSPMKSEGLEGIPGQNIIERKMNMPPRTTPKKCTTRIVPAFRKPPTRRKR